MSAVVPVAQQEKKKMRKGESGIPVTACKARTYVIKVVFNSISKLSLCDGMYYLGSFCLLLNLGKLKGFGRSTETNLLLYSQCRRLHPG